MTKCENVFGVCRLLAERSRAETAAPANDVGKLAAPDNEQVRHVR
jgi:hypothetical protein